MKGVITIDPISTVSSFRVWLMAVRPRTLPAAVAPVLVGTAFAAAEQGFRFLPALAALAGALLLQIGVNLANDYFDCQKGVDTEDRLGPVRVTQCGLIPSPKVKNAMGFVFGMATLIGLYLVTVAGWPILAIGIASILAALAYSGGPYPLASNRLGDLFVFIFFGLVAVCGTYYVQTLQVTVRVVWMAAAVGSLITAILVVNNLRDIPTDSRTDKQTLAVALGSRATKVEYALLLLFGYAQPVSWWLKGQLPGAALLPLVSLPMAIFLIVRIHTLHGKDLNRLLALTANLALIFSLLLAIGLVWK